MSKVQTVFSLSIQFLKAFKAFLDSLQQPQKYLHKITQRQTHRLNKIIQINVIDQICLTCCQGIIQCKAI